MLLGGLLFVFFIVAAPTLDEGLACIMHARAYPRKQGFASLDTRQTIGRSVE